MGLRKPQSPFFAAQLQINSRVFLLHAGNIISTRTSTNESIQTRLSLTPMRFISTYVLNCPNRIRNRFYLSYQFMSCAVQTLDLPDESRTCDSSYDELKSRMQSYASSGNIRQAIESLYSMKSVHGKPTVYDYNALIYYYLKSKDVLHLKELVRVYFKMKESGPYPNASTFKTLFNGMLLLGRIEEALFILREMHESGFIPSFTIVTKLLKSSLKFETLSGSVLEFMLKLDYFPTTIIANRLIVILSRIGMIAEAYNLFTVLLSRHEYEGAHNYNPILWALCKSNQRYTALALFCFVRKKGLDLSLYTYTALIHGFSKEMLFDEAFHCLNQMKIEGFSPNSWTYTTIIKFLCDDQKINEGLDLLSKMEKEGCNPNLVTCNIILLAISKRNMVNEIDDLFQRMDQYGFEPDPFTHAALATGYLSRGKVGFAKEYLHNMYLGQQFLADVVILNIYLNILCIEKNYNEAELLLNTMRSKGLWTSISYNTVLKWICEYSSLEHALEFFDQVDRVNNWSDSVSCNTIFSAACKIRDSSMIRRIADRMGYEGFKINDRSRTCLINYFGQVDIQDCINYVTDMMTNGILPNTIHFNTLMSNLCKISTNKAYDTFVCVKSIGVLPDTTTYNILVRAALKHRNDKLAFKLVTEMKHNQYLKRDVVTYGLDIYLLCRNGKIDEAITEKNKMREKGINPNIDIYNTIMEAIFKGRKAMLINPLLSEMNKDGCEFNQVSCDLVNNILNKNWLKGFPAEAIYLKMLLLQVEKGN